MEALPFLRTCGFWTAVEFREGGLLKPHRRASAGWVGSVNTISEHSFLPSVPEAHVSLCGPEK